MAKIPVKKIQTPTGDLKYAFITGKGRLKPRSKDEYAYSCAVVVDKKEGKKLYQEILDYFNDNKPAKCKADEPENNIYTKMDDGRWMFQFRTNTEFEGKPNVVKVFNKDNEPRELPEGVGIGDGSRGQILGGLQVYEGDTPAEAGCSMYLNAVRIGKFVAYEGGATFEGEMDDEDADFEDFDPSDFPSEKEDKEPKKEKKAKKKKKKNKE